MGVGEGCSGGVLEVFEGLPGGEDGGFGCVEVGLGGSGAEVGEVLFALGESALGVGEGCSGGVLEVFKGLPGGEDGGFGGVEVGLRGAREEVGEILLCGIGSGSGCVDVGLRGAGEEVGEVLFALGEPAACVGDGCFGGVLEVFEGLPGGEDRGFGGG